VTRRRLWRGWLACAGLAIAGVVACNEVGTNPSSPVSITLLPLPVPSLTVGDSLRDSTGRAVPLRAIVFNTRDDTIPDAPVRYLALDPLHRVALDPVTGNIVGQDTGQVKIVAAVGALQTQPLTITIVEPPTALVAQTKLVDTLDYTRTFGIGARDTLFGLSVKLVHVKGADTIPVSSYLVRYAFEHPAGYSNTDSTKIQLVNANRRASLIDTTGIGSVAGVSTRYLRITPAAATATDSVILLVSAALPNATPVPGSPVRFVVHYTIK
jgi:hypothetical protein